MKNHKGLKGTLGKSKIVCEGWSHWRKIFFFGGDIFPTKIGIKTSTIRVSNEYHRYILQKHSTFELIAKNLYILCCYLIRINRNIGTLVRATAWSDRSMYIIERRRLSDIFEQHVAQATPEKYVHIWAAVVTTNRSVWATRSISAHSRSSIPIFCQFK